MSIDTCCELVTHSAPKLSGFDKTRDRPDILALDAQGKLVVVEIKRDESGSGQDLQALRYAAYASTIQADQVVELFRTYRRAEHGETLDADEARSKLEAFVGAEALDRDPETPPWRVAVLARATFRAPMTGSSKTFAQASGSAGTQRTGGSSLAARRPSRGSRASGWLPRPTTGSSSHRRRESIVRRRVAAAARHAVIRHQALTTNRLQQ